MERTFLKGKLTLFALIMAASALIVMTIGLYFNAPAQAADTPDNRKMLTVSGQAKVNASPDIAYINLGVVTEDKDAKTAQKANAASMDKVISTLKAAGIKAEDIKTVNYSIYPKYEYSKDGAISNIVGYTINNSVNVTVRDLTKTGDIIDAATDSGVNMSSSISFGLKNYEDFYNEALKNAVLAAKKKASTMAGALGVTLKAPISVNEGGGYSPLMNYAAYDMKASLANGATPIQAGSLEITANVNIVYEY